MHKLTERFEPEGHYSLSEVPTITQDSVVSRTLTHNDQFTFKLVEIPAARDSGFTSLVERTTCVVIGGSATVSVQRPDGSTRTEDLGEGDGWYQPTKARARIVSKDPVKIITACSPVIKLSKEEAKEVFPWLPDDYFFSQEPDSPLQRAYRVEKPWGGEAWLSVLEDGYVLKRIWMKRSKQSSLQQHVYKTETNYLIKGKAKLLLADTIEELEPTSRMIGPGEGWYVPTMKIHRVISQEDYLAYEVSTPHVKDVIRLADDTGRTSGHLESEHKTNE